MEAKQLVTELLESGLTQVEISERSGVAQSSLSKLANGMVDDIMSRNYRALETLHRRVMHSKRRRLARVSREADAVVVNR